MDILEEAGRVVADYDDELERQLAEMRAILKGASPELVTEIKTIICILYVWRYIPEESRPRVIEMLEMAD